LESGDQFRFGDAISSNLAAVQKHDGDQFLVALLKLVRVAFDVAEFQVE
jgi:hypothetical protein